MDEDRVVKILLPISLIRQIDEAIVAGLGGYSTRAEFVRDAAEGLLLELTYEPAPNEPVGRSNLRRSSVDNVRVAASTEPPTESALPPPASEVLDRLDAARATDDDLTVTQLHAPDQTSLIESGEAEIDNEPLFGMHNRDYPSLWVAHQLAKRTHATLVSYQSFIDEVTEEAWKYADRLKELEPIAGQKLTALFPTNRAKPQSAADGFRAFAIGYVLNGGREPMRAEGPLFAWRACQVTRQGDSLLLGLTPAGRDLLHRLDGISLSLPHPPGMTAAFLSHLRENAPGDWWGFKTVLTAVAQQPNRAELIEAFRQARPDWTESVAGTNAQGYVARAREWGLVEPKQAAGRYSLTDFGAEHLSSELSSSTNGGSKNNG